MDIIEPKTKPRVYVVWARRDKLDWRIPMGKLDLLETLQKALEIAESHSIPHQGEREEFQSAVLRVL